MLAFPLSQQSHAYASLLTVAPRTDQRREWCEEHQWRSWDHHLEQRTDHLATVHVCAWSSRELLLSNPTVGTRPVEKEQRMEHCLPSPILTQAKPCLNPSSVALRKTSPRSGRNGAGARGYIAVRSQISTVNSTTSQSRHVYLRHTYF